MVQLLDLGKEILAVAMVNDNQFIISADNNTKLGPNKLSINLDNVAIYSVTNSLRLA